MPLRSVLVLMLVISCGSLFGCGSPEIQLTPVKGTVTFKGEALTDAQITFSPSAEKANLPIGTAVSNGQGEFTVSSLGREGMAIGEYNVSVIRNKTTTQKIDTQGIGTGSAQESQAKMLEVMQKSKGMPNKEQMSGSGNVGPMQKSVDTSDSLIPPRYNDPSKSQLRISVKKDSADNLKIKLELVE